jgi:hypothetical protein
MIVQVRATPHLHARRWKLRQMTPRNVSQSRTELYCSEHGPPFGNRHAQLPGATTNLQDATTRTDVRHFDDIIYDL